MTVPMGVSGLGDTLEEKPSTVAEHQCHAELLEEEGLRLLQ